MMSGRVWRVRYSNDADARTVRRDLAGNAIVRCGSAGALWRATVVDGPPDGGGPIDVELWPLDPHAIDPTVPVRELLIPSELAP